MGYQFTSQQIATLNQLIVEINAGTKEWYDAYHAVMGFISETDSGTGEFTGPKVGVDGAVWQFIAAGDLINAGAQAQSQITRDYTASQILIRGTLPEGANLDAQIQEASDRIAEAVISRIVATGELPTIDVIAEDDASEAAAFLFGDDLGGWAGNPLFVAFGHDESWQNNVLAESRGTYDILAAVVSGWEAFGNMSIDDLGEAFGDFWETASGSDVGVGDFWDAWISDTNAALNAAYDGLVPVVDIGLGAMFDNIFLGTIHDDESIKGSNGVDILHGGAGDDVIVGAVAEAAATGGDVIDGGDGNDTADYSTIERGLIIALANEVNTSAVTFTAEVVVTLTAFAQQIDHLFNIESIIGSDLVDTLYLAGNSMTAFSSLETIDLAGNRNGKGDIVDASSFDGGAAIDLSGTSSGSLHVLNAEIVIGSAFNDTIRGGNAAETLDGGEGKDYLAGGTEADELTGGDGADQFIVAGNDVILDPDFDDNVGFDDGDGNVIWLSGGNRAGGDEEDTGDGRDEYSPADGFYYEDTGAGTVVYHWVEGSSHLTINLPDGSVIDVHDWENGKAGIELITTPDDDKYDESNALGSPLVLDLDGDGVELTETSNSRAYFDLDQDGFAERTGWVGPDDGLLALDVNSNGTIDDIAELFGVEGNWDYDQLATELNTTGKLPSGFDKLRLLDNNSDGVIDAADSAFDDLRVWQDLNGDGVSQAGELSSLSALGIASLSLTSTQQIVGEGSNAITDFGTFTRTDSSTGDLVDVWFGYDGQATKDLTPTAIDPATANLPKLHAYGEAGSLSEAMSADAQLLSMVTDFTNLTVADAAELETRVEDILLRWYGADGIDPLSRGDSVNAGWLTALEHIYGTPWRYPSDSPNPNSNGGALLAEAWRDYKSTILVQLLAQTPLGQTLFPGLAFSGMAFLTLPDTLSLEDVLGNLSANAPTDGIEKLQFWHSMILALDALYPEFKELLPPPGEEEEEVDFEPIFIDAIETALAAAGIAYSYDQLRGGDLGTAGNDVLVGVGSTYDPDLDPDLRFEALLVGGDGNDTYLVGSATFGPGIDIIVEGSDGGTDTVKSWENYTLTANVENLTLLGTTGLSGTGNDLANSIVGNTGGNVLTGLGGADTLEGGGGNDTLQGGDGADSISLGTGKDRVSFASVLEAGDIVTGFTTSGTEQDTINLDALFDALNGGISSAARAGRVQLVETGTDVELRIDTAAGTGAGDGVGDVTLMLFAGMTSAAGLSIGTLSTSDIQVGTA